MLEIWRKLRTRKGRAQAAALLRKQTSKRRSRIFVPLLATLDRKKPAAVAAELAAQSSDDEAHGQLGDELLRAGKVRAAL